MSIQLIMSWNIKHEVGARLEQAKIIEISTENQRKKHTINYLHLNRF